MKDLFRNASQKIRKDRKHFAMSVVSVIITFVMVYTLIMPAVAMEKSEAAKEPGMSIEETVDENVSAEAMAEAEAEEDASSEETADDAAEAEAIEAEAVAADAAEADAGEATIEDASVPAAAPAAENNAADGNAAVTDASANASAAIQDGGAGNTGAAQNGGQTAAAEENKADASDKADDSDAAKSDADKEMPAQTFEQVIKYKEIIDEDGNTVEKQIKVAVDAAKNTFPAGTTMKAELILDNADVEKAVEDAVKQAAGELADATSIVQYRAVDITFADKDGQKVEPAKKVEVRITSDKVAEIVNPLLVHVNVNDQNGRVINADVFPKKDVSIIDERPDTIDGNENTMLFKASRFSPYVIVESQTIDEDGDAVHGLNSVEENADNGAEAADGEGNGKSGDGVLIAESDSYTVTIKYDEKANIPDDAEIDIKEIPEASRQYKSYMSEAEKLLVGDADKNGENASGSKAINYAKMVDVNIVSASEGTVTPDADVDVDIAYKETEEIAEGTVMQALSFNGRNAEVEKDALVYGGETHVDGLQVTTDKMPAYAIVGTETITIEHIDHKGTKYEVTVTYGPEAKIPEGSTLRVTDIENDTKAYEDARNAVLADKKEKDEFVDIDDFNLAALDISIIDPNGQEIEPEAAVTVDIKIKDLPKVENLDEIKETLEIQHHVEVPDGVVIEKVFDGSIEGSYKMDIDENIAKAGTIVDPSSVSEEDFKVSDEDEETPIDVSFETDDFSVFTITWGNGGSRRQTTIHYGYTDESTGRFVEFTDPVTETSYSTSYYDYLVRDFDGYVYSGYSYYRTSTSETPATGGTRIQALLRYNSSHWRYHAYRTDWQDTNWNDMANNSHVYVLYNQSTIQDGGKPKTKPVNPGEEPDAPSILKESKPNGDGTADLSLSIRGSTVDQEVEKLADVIVVFDVSGSMNDNMNGGSSTSWTNPSRLNIAKNAVTNLVDTLASKKDSAGNPLIRMSLITFSTNAQPELGLTDLTDEGVRNYKDAVNGLSATGGTNWEKALRLANETVIDPERATFVIFVSDGDPTYRESRQGAEDREIQGYDRRANYLLYNVIGEGDDDSNNRNYNAALDVAKSIVQHKKNFYTIGISNDVTNMASLNSSAGGQGNYTATSSAQLEQAFDDIATSIQALMGAGDIHMTDGITDMTNTVEKSGLVGVSGDFTYWKAPAPADWNTMTAEQKAAYKPADSAFVEWDPSSERCEEAEYDEASGSVKWDMGSNFVPQNGCTYKVTFKAWPSQEAYDILAKCKNDPTYYDTLSDAQKDQIIQIGDTYSLKTNDKTPNTTYKDATKSGDTVTTSGDAKTLLFNDVDPLGMDSSQISIKKEWDNQLDGREESGSYEFPVKADTADFGKVTLSSTQNPKWQNSYYISTGLMTTDPYVVYEKGHDYTIEEPSNLSYNWDFKSDVYHPMVINNQVVNLIKVDSAAGSDYTIDGKYYKILSGNAMLTATNERRSNLNISKTVVDKDGNHIESDQAFTFTVTVDEGHDDEVWLSAYDTIAGETVKDSSIVTGNGVQYQESDGYFHAPSGTTLTLKLKDGWNYRFTNLSVGSTYSIEENSPVPDGYTFASAAATATNGATAGTVTGQKTEGTVDKSNSVYTAAYTNRANTTTLKFRKTEEDGTTPLAGAVIEIVKDSSAIEGSPFTTTTDDIELTLFDGIYRVKETASPSGYVILNGEMYFKAINGTVTITDQDGNEKTYDDFTMDTENGVIVLKLKNHPGDELPNTGGPGTLPYTLGGIALIMASALMYGFRMRRRERRLN